MPTPEEYAKGIAGILELENDVGQVAYLAEKIRDAVAEEREACAKIAHAEISMDDSGHRVAKLIERLIRARGTRRVAKLEQLATRCSSVSSQGLNCQLEAAHRGKHCAIRATGLKFSDDASDDEEGTR